jgi:hypothetical protein
MIFPARVVAEEEPSVPQTQAPQSLHVVDEVELVGAEVSVVVVAAAYAVVVVAAAALAVEVVGFACGLVADAVVGIQFGLQPYHHHLADAVEEEAEEELQTYTPLVVVVLEALLLNQEEPLEEDLPKFV